MNWVGVARGLAGESDVLMRALRRGSSHGRACIRIGVFASLASLGACNLNNPGINPPRGKLAYPIALGLSKQVDERGAPRYLYVANANFDLHYNAGSVHAYDLEQLELLLSNNHCLDYDPDQPLDAGSDAGDALDGGEDAGDADFGMDADANDAGLDGAGDEGSDGAADDGAADAGEDDAGDDASTEAPIAAIDAGGYDVSIQTTKRGVLCDGRVTLNNTVNDPEDETICCFGKASVLDGLRKSEVTIDSFASGLSVSPDGETIYVPVRSTNRLVYIASSDGDLSCGTDKGRCQRGAKLGDKADDEDLGFAPQPTAVVTGNFMELGLDRDDDFVVTAHEQGEVALFRIGEGGEPVLLDVQLAVSQRAVSIYPDGESKFLYVGAVAANAIERLAVRTLDDDAQSTVIYTAPSLSLRGLTGTQDIRDIMLDSRPRPDGAPLRAYALMRGGNGSFSQSVAFVELAPETSDGRFGRSIDAVRVGDGPSRLAQADIGGRHLLFASCYDAAEIRVIDVDRRETVAVIYDVLGPYDMRIDVSRQLMYVTDFRASVLRVVDLHSLFVHSSAAPRVVATLGVPTAPGKVQ